MNPEVKNDGRMGGLRQLQLRVTYFLSGTQGDQSRGQRGVCWLADGVDCDYHRIPCRYRVRMRLRIGDLNFPDANFPECEGYGGRRDRGTCAIPLASSGRQQQAR